MADTLSPPDWMTPWEAWAFTQILNGENADMSEVPDGMRGSTDVDHAPVIWPLLRDEKGKPLKNADDLFQPAEDEAWPNWQVLSARFLEHVTMDRAFIEARRRNRVRIFSARVREKVDFAGGRLPGELWLDRCRLDEEPNFRDTEIRGLLSLETSFFVSGLHADGLVTMGDVILSGGARFDGEVRLPGADIGGLLSCIGSHFNPDEEGRSLNADGLVIRGDVILSGGARFGGTVRLLGAEIGGDLVCVGSRFKAGENGSSLKVEGSVVKGGMFLRGGAQFEGQISLVRARIAGSLQLCGSEFDGRIDLMSAYMSELLLDGTSRSMAAPEWKDNASLDLTNAEIGALHSSFTAWRRKDGNLIKRQLDGLQVRRLSGAVGGESLKDARAKDIRNWLCDGQSFSPSPYLTVAKALKEEGESEKARSIRIELEKQRTRHMQWRSWSWPMKLFRRCWLGPVTGYGYSAARGVIILVGAIVVFAWAGSVWHSVHTAGSFSGTRLPSLGEFLPWLGFSFETAIPLADLDPVHDTFLEDQFNAPVIEALQKKDYAALPPGIRALFMGERFLGLAILATLIASLTGWAEQRGSGD